MRILPTGFPAEIPSINDILKHSPGWLEEAVNTSEASRLVGFPVCTLHTWRSRGDGPPFLKIGARSVRYQRRALLQWMAERQRRNTADKGEGHGR
jgi:predicted DNA-binding transcriptional regulator AlpA